MSILRANLPNNQYIQSTELPPENERELDDSSQQSKQPLSVNKAPDLTAVGIVSVDGGFNARQGATDGVFNLNVGFLVTTGRTVQGGVAAGFRYSLLTHPANEVRQQLMGGKLSLALTAPFFAAEAGPLLQTDLETGNGHYGVEGSVNFVFLFSAVGLFVGTNDVRPSEEAGVFGGLRVSGWFGRIDPF